MISRPKRSRRSPHPPVRHRLVAMAVALALLGGACGGQGAPDLKIGLQRVALDLAFKSGEGEPKAAPQQTLAPTVVPSQAEFAVTVVPETFDRPPPRQLGPIEPPCPKAQNALPEAPVTSTVLVPPTAGRYRIHRTGTFAVESAVFPFRGQMPPVGEKEYRNVKAIPGTTDAFGQRSPDQFEWEVFEQTGDNHTSRTMRTTATAIQLVKQVTKVGSTTVTFTPTPPITLVGLGTGVGHSWSSAGVDTATGTSMVVQGRIARRENVDLCGKVYDTFVVESTERITNVRDQYTSQTNDANNTTTGEGAGKPNTYWVATQHGGLFVQEEFHTTTTLTTEVAGARVPVTLKLDYVNTFDSITPAGPPRG